MPNKNYGTDLVISPQNMMFSVSFLKERYWLECAVSVMAITNGNGQ